MLKRSRSYYRHHRLRSINRKKRILKNKWTNNSYEWLINNERNVGKLSKGKIHCSCGMCTEKTKVWGYKSTEKSKINQMEKDIKKVLKLVDFEDY